MADGTCVITMSLEVPLVGGGTITAVFDCDTLDADGNLWVWTRLEGWWEPPEPIYDQVLLGDTTGGVLGSVVTASRYGPRALTLAASVDCRQGSLNAARDKLTLLSNMITAAGTLTVDDSADPRYATVYLADRPSQTVLGSGSGIEIELPLIAYDAYRHLVSDDTGVI